MAQTLLVPVAAIFGLPDKCGQRSSSGCGQAVQWVSATAVWCCFPGAEHAVFAADDSADLKKTAAATNCWPENSEQDSQTE
jgi:hypothetical protein